MINNIAVYGAGGFGKEIKMLIDQINIESLKFNFIGFFDDKIPKGIQIEDYSILGGINELNSYTDNLNLVFGFGDPKSKENVFNKITNKNIYYPTLIHPSCILDSKTFSFGKGCIICAGTIITVNVHLADFITLNLSCTIGHDSKIGSFSSFMPSTNISGEVSIGKRVYCGTGSTIINSIAIGDNSTIGAGAVVTKDLPSNCTAVGIPARPIKFNAG